MRKITPKLIAGACTGFMVLSMWASPAGAEEPKVRDPGPIKAAGKVTSISGNTFNLQTPKRGELKVQHDSETRWRNLTADALKAGAQVVVMGKLTGDVVHADAVGSVPKARKEGAKKRMAKRHALKGVVTAVKDSGFTLQTKRGKIEVSFNDDTTFRGGSAADIKKGAKIGVVPVRPKDGEKDSVRMATKVTAKVIGFPKAKRQERPIRSKERRLRSEDRKAKAAY